MPKASAPDDNDRPAAIVARTDARLMPDNRRAFQTPVLYCGVVGRVGKIPYVEAVNYINAHFEGDRCFSVFWGCSGQLLLD